MTGHDASADPSDVDNADARTEASEGDRPGSLFHRASRRHSGEQVLDDDGQPWSNID
ncbi:hypothetical protein LK459_17225 [Gordonia otitidis]|uniref:hypothetical protein n=1 Tax=Gordonia otitidis TaxID=249058 RepID=UPI001D13696D|nr:hypothetical protein [Gordonia otitidis]UEA58311.1 hypothetical protein LK459_17225 [Gordonia otitidis]